MEPNTGYHLLSIRGNTAGVYYKDPTGAEAPSLIFPQENVNAKDQLISVARQYHILVAKGYTKECYELLDSEGQEYDAEVPTLPRDWRYGIFYKSILQRHLSFEHDAWNGLCSGPRDQSIAYIGAIPASGDETSLYDHDELDNFQRLKPLLPDMDKIWETSTAAKQITDFLNTHSNFMNTVTKVVGFDLGEPGERRLAQATETSYFQHLTLLHIAHELEKAQGKQKLRVFVQDPAYNSLSKAVLGELSTKFNREIEIVEDPNGLLEMDEQTIVFHCRIPFDIADLAVYIAGENGLAGLLGAKIDVDPQKQKKSGHHVFQTQNSRNKHGMCNLQKPNT